MPYRDEQIGANLSVPAGATVYDMSGQKLGKVAGGMVQREYFQLERGLLFHHDYYVPKGALARIDAASVHLNVTLDELKTSGWDHPPNGNVETLGHREEPQV